jgi:cell wall-associated NlpC family hydrolase
MPKLRRGGFIFLTWKGDHGPRHVHVYRGGRLVLKWDLDNEKAMEGKPTRRLLDLIRELETEGLL